MKAAEKRKAVRDELARLTASPDWWTEADYLQSKHSSDKEQKELRLLKQMEKR